MPVIASNQLLLRVSALAFLCACGELPLEEGAVDAGSSGEAPNAQRVAGPSFTSLGNALASSPAVVLDASYRINVFVVTTTGALETRKQLTPTGDFAGWESLGSGFAALTPAVAKNQDGKLQVFAVAQDGSLRTRMQSTAGGAWGAWVSLGGFTSFGPAVGQNLDGRLEVFVVGADRAVHHKWQGSPSGAFSPNWSNFGGVSVFTPAIGRTFDGKMDVFVVGLDGRLNHRVQSGPNIAFGPWLAFAGNAGQQPTVARNLDGRLEVFIVGPEGRIWHRAQTSTSGSWSSNWKLFSPGEGATAQPLSAALNKLGHLEVLGVRSDGAPFQRFQNTPVYGAWGAVDDDAWGDENRLTGLLATGPLATVMNYDGAVQVFARGSDGRLFHMVTAGLHTHPDMMVQIRHPITGCLDPDTAPAMRARLQDAFGETYPGMEVLERCRNGETTFGVFTADLPTASEAPARDARLAALGLVRVRGNGQIGFFYDERFVLAHARRTLAPPKRYDEDGNEDPEGAVEIEQLWDVDFLGLDIVRTELIGTVHIPASDPAFEMTVTDTLRITDTRKPDCASTAFTRIDNPDWRLHLVPIIGTVFHEIIWLGIDDARGPRDAPSGGGTGCSLAASLPDDLVVDLGASLRTLKLDLLYDVLEVSVQGFHASAAFQLVPRVPTVNIEGFRFVVGSVAHFGIVTDDLRGTLAVRWMSDGVVESPTAAQTNIRFDTVGTHWVRVTATDEDGGSASQQIEVRRLW